MVLDALVGAIIAIIIFLISTFTIKKWRERRNKKQIYDWLYEHTKHLEPYTVGSPKLSKTWPSTMEISWDIDLPEERVRCLCSADNRIQQQRKSDLWPNQELEERWAIKTFVRN
ncbi:MAG: hypothetical protein U9Q37_02845 [Euryarchaeota archaeon]|nr:hypothetical protein [Euryarchaeota archaeon]